MNKEQLEELQKNYDFACKELNETIKLNNDLRKENTELWSQRNEARSIIEEYDDLACEYGAEDTEDYKEIRHKVYQLDGISDEQFYEDYPEDNEDEPNE